MEAKLIFLFFLLGASFPFHLAATNRTDSQAGHGNLSISEKGGAKASCLAGWVISPNKSKCFKYVGSLLSWNYSESHCKVEGGHLAALVSSQDLSFVRKLCSRSESGCWVGGRGRLGSTGNWAWDWSDRKSKWNESVVVKVPSISKCPKQPCFSNATEFCAFISNGSLALSGEVCTNSHAYVCMRNVENKCFHMRCHREYLIALAVVSGLILCTTASVIIWLLVYRRNKKWRRSRKLANPSSSALVPPTWRVFTKEELKAVTKNFSEGNRLLGDAKTGGTYSGVLPDGSKVAVKRLKRSSVQRKKEFFSVVGRVAKLHHQSLVVIKGCCYDHGDRYIIYEFIAQGPLDRWLHHVPRGGKTLDWAIRLKIAINLAQGIAFLHDNVKPQVVHQDIRASNVLLDEEFGAHLMGVGLSKFVPWEVMHERTMMAGGTYGYLAPEFVYRNELTTKSDVYSFGVLLLEIVTGRRPAEEVESVGWQSIFEWATPLVQAHRYTELLDPLMTSSSSFVIPESSVVQKVVDLVYSCTQHVPSMRPRMSHVVHQLQQLA
uniref:C-type lectin receptor-like tyrosine-protein kinase At1g52310 n=1 Tax=Kalanchoe fedtschenkoi TaxID=63787 RepID=A0A7N0ZVX8_KALFE